MIPYDYNNFWNAADYPDFYYDQDISSSGDWKISGEVPELVNHSKLLKDILECKSVNDFLRRIGEDLQWEDLR